jgi:hypothetical protein
MSFNEQYDKTIAKGLCFQCGKNPVQVLFCEKTKTQIETLWCWVCSSSEDEIIDLTEEEQIG